MHEHPPQPTRPNNVYYLTTGARDALGPENSDRRWFLIKVGKREFVEQHASSSLAALAVMQRLQVFGATARVLP